MCKKNHIAHNLFKPIWRLPFCKLPSYDSSIERQWRFSSRAHLFEYRARQRGTIWTRTCRRKKEQWTIRWETYSETDRNGSKDEDRCESQKRQKWNQSKKMKRRGQASFNWYLYKSNDIIDDRILLISGSDCSYFFIRF